VGRLTLTFFLLLGLIPALRAEDVALPSASFVLERLRHSVAELTANKGRPRFIAAKTNIVGLAKQKETQTRVYSVWSDGLTTKTHLLWVDGRSATQEDKESEGEREAVGRKEKRQRLLEEYLTPEITNQFVFTVTGREMTNGRSILILNLSPKTGKKTYKNIFERVIGHMSGQLKVDEEDWRIVQGHIYLAEKMEMWAGLLGSLEKIQLDFVRRRVAPAIWLDDTSDLAIEGRKLFETIHVDIQTTFSDYTNQVPQKPNL
jgi:hypothetical protein